MTATAAASCWRFHPAHLGLGFFYKGCELADASLHRSPSSLISRLQTPRAHEFAARSHYQGKQKFVRVGASASRSPSYQMAAHVGGVDVGNGTSSRVPGRRLLSRQQRLVPLIPHRVTAGHMPEGAVPSPPAPPMIAPYRSLYCTGLPPRLSTGVRHFQSEGFRSSMKAAISAT